ncbi:MAG: hypothetical protein A3F09_02840 [Chlamydiae bacterium RIFCSPHIGHO2_12_FULL_49_11]|nr:MAG: hypothetical protein A3F09_02840 [Chlamydiae bacterium RIFCSPHIGHO2_12_FULL_49_11]
MKSKKRLHVVKVVLRVISILLMVSGTVLFILALTISGQVEEGKGKADKAQKNVNTARQITSSSSYTKDIGEAATDPIQQKINAGRRDIKKYGQLVQVFYIVAICTVGTGVPLFIISFFPRRKRK